MEIYFIKGFFIALIFGVPAGAIGALTIQRTLEHGFYAGFLTGLGSSVADVLYACISVFGITIISDVLIANQTPMRLIGGTLILLLGIKIFRKKSLNKKTENQALPVYFGSAFAIAIANPATIFAFFIAFASVGITENPSIFQGIQIAAGIFTGTCLWWLLLSGIVCLFRNRINDKIYQRLNQLLGILMVLFGIILVITQ